MATAVEAPAGILYLQMKTPSCGWAMIAVQWWQCSSQQDQRSVWLLNHSNHPALCSAASPSPLLSSSLWLMQTGCPTLPRPPLCPHLTAGGCQEASWSPLLLPPQPTYPSGATEGTAEKVLHGLWGMTGVFSSKKYTNHCCEGTSKESEAYNRAMFWIISEWQMNCQKLGYRLWQKLEVH